MSLKTEYGYVEDDFVQNGNGMQELTVTITLSEYRNLIKYVATQDITIEKLQEENNKLKERSNAYEECIVSYHPEIIEKSGDFAKLLLNIPIPGHPTEKGGEKE